MVIFASPKTVGHSPKRQVGRDDDRGSFVELADQVKQELTADLGEREIPQFIEDQEVEA